MCVLTLYEKTAECRHLGDVISKHKAPVVSTLKPQSAALGTLRQHTSASHAALFDTMLGVIVMKSLLYLIQTNRDTVEH